MKQDSTLQPQSNDIKSIESIIDISDKLTSHHFGNHEHKGLHRLKTTIDQLKAFIQLRHPIEKFAKLKPIYLSLTKKTKLELIDLCIQYKHMPILPRHYKPMIKPIEETNQ